MTMQRNIVGFLLVMSVLATTSCGITVNRVETGALRTEVVNVAKPADLSKTMDVELQPGAASVEVAVGNDKLVEGRVEYNVDDWKPIIINAAQRVVIRQNEFLGIPPTNVRNDWRIKLGKDVPMNLAISTGAMRGTMELGGLSLRTFAYRQGAADATVSFSQPNNGEMTNFTIDAGASRLRALGLAYCNASSGQINIGAGALTLSLDGKLTRDLDITINGGAAAVTIDSGGNPVQLILNQGLSAVTVNGWTKNKQTYTSPEWAGAKGAKVTVHANLNAASLTLESGQ